MKQTMVLDPTVRPSNSTASDIDSPLRWFDCPDVGCTWPCAHHLHENRLRSFTWYPDLEHFGNQHPEIPKDQSEMKIGMNDCQFCRIFFSIGQSDCHCGENAKKSAGCRCIKADCQIRSNGQLSNLLMEWRCGGATCELGLPTGKLVWSLSDLSTNESFLVRL